MGARRPTRLEIHRLKRAAGKPSQFLLMDELDEDERMAVGQEFFSEVWADGHRRDLYEIYAEVLARWGIMCPHPKERRNFLSRWSECQVCGSIVPCSGRDDAPIRAWG